MGRPNPIPEQQPTATERNAAEDIASLDLAGARQRIAELEARKGISRPVAASNVVAVH